MNLQHSPNWWSCLPTAFAIALDVSVRELIAEIGHDGSDIIFPDQPEPYSRRSFHIQEFISPCLKRDYALLIVEAVPTIHPDYPIQFPEGNAFRIIELMKEYIGVLAGEHEGGKPHAMAWDKQHYYDPDYDMPLIDANLQIREFFALIEKA